MAEAFARLGFLAADLWTHADEGNFDASLCCVSRPSQGGGAPEKARIFHDDHGRSLALDGQLYDRQTLIAALGGRPDSPSDGGRNSEDANLIFAAYARWGDRCVDFLNGDFAFVLTDRKARRALLARDPVGVKPLFYIQNCDTVLFASNVKALRRARPDIDELDENHLLRCLSGGNYFSPTDTFFSRIKKLPAAHSMTLSSEGVAIRRYWHPETIRAQWFGTDVHSQTRLLSLLEDAVQDRLGASGRIGVHITGGLDSSMVATLTRNSLSDMSRKPPLGYCWQPAPDETNANSNEHRWIRRIIEHTKIDTKFITPTADGLEAIYRRDCTVEPCDKTLFNEHPVQETAGRDGVSIILSGWGGDQIISHKGKTLRHEIAEAIRKRIDGLLTRRWMPLTKRSILGRLAGETVDHRRKNSEYRSSSKNHVAGPYRERVVRLNAHQPLSPADLKGRQLHYLQGGAITRRIEEWAASGQEHGIEYRYPLLDKRVVEFALSMPSWQYRRGSKNRYIFRRTLAQIAPTDLSWSDTKHEAQRVEALRVPFVEMSRRLAKDLRTGRVRPERARYVDVDRLIATVEDDDFALSGVYGPTQTALRILDFPTK